MKVINTDSDGASVHFTMDELDVMRNGLLEARLLLTGRDGADFATRIGVSVEEASGLIKALQALIKDIDEKSGHRHSQPPVDTKAKLTG